MQAFSVPAVFKAIDKFTPVMKKMGNSVKSFSSKAQANLARVDRSLRKLTPSMGSFTKQMISMAGAMLIATAIYGTADAINSYRENVASLQAITGATDKTMLDFKESIKGVGTETGKSLGEIAKGFEIVGSAKPELLANAAALGEVTKAAVILSQASGDELESSALSLTGTMNQFNLGANQSVRVMNALAAGSVAGSANITNIAASMKNFGAVADASNLSVEQAIALVEVMGSKSIFAEEAGTKLSASMLNLKKSGFGYASGQFKVNDALKEAKAKMESLTTAKQKDIFMNKVFGKTGITAGTILLSNIKQFEDLTTAVTGTNTATEQAAIKQATLSKRFETLKNTLFNMAIGADESSGSFNGIANAIGWVTDNLNTIIPIIGTLLALFIGMKTIIIAANVVMTAFAVGQGIMAAAAGIGTAAIEGNIIAMNAYKVAMGIGTVFTWLFNAAWYANPIVWIVAAIIAAIALVIAIIMNWGAISEWFSEKWKAIGEWFKTFDFVHMFRQIGAAIVKFMIWPVIALLKLLAQVPGKVGEMATAGLAEIDNFTAKIEGEPADSPINTDKEKMNAEQTMRAEAGTNSSIGININDKGGNVESIDNPDGLPVTTTPALGGF